MPAALAIDPKLEVIMHITIFVSEVRKAALVVKNLQSVFKTWKRSDLHVFAAFLGRRILHRKGLLYLPSWGQLNNENETVEVSLALHVKNKILT